jgi:hypothetical protein
MTDISVFKNFTEYVSNKNQAGNSLTVSQFNDVAHRAQMQVFEKDRAIFITEGIMSDFLKTFASTRIYNKNSAVGEFVIPVDLEHISELRTYHLKKDGTGIDVELDEVKNSDWGKITGSSLFEASSRFPKYSEWGSVVRYLPKDLNILTLDYLRTPVAPEWAFTTVNNRPVYNAANSVNFEWADFSFNNVAAMFLQIVGVNLKDAELSNFAQLYKQETNSVI